MRLALLLSLAFLAATTYAQDKKEQKPATLRSVLLDQLKTTHDKNDWFVSPSKSVEGLTPEQVTWTDGKGNHSIGQLAYHMVFWNSQELAKFKGEQPAKFDGNNDETFNNFDAKIWTDKPHVILLRSEDAQIRPSEAHRQAEGLALGHDHVRAVFCRAF